MLNNFKSKIKEVGEKQKAKKEEKERKRQEQIKANEKKQVESREILDEYYSKYQELKEYIEHTTFENLYKIYNSNNKYDEYFRLCNIFKELKEFDYTRYGILDINIDFGYMDAFVDRIKNKYNNDKLMIKFYNDPYRFKSLITEYNISIEDIDKTVYKRFKNKLDKLLWEKYDSPQIKKIKFFYDLFLSEVNATSVSFSVTLSDNNSSSINGYGSGNINYENMKSIYDFIFSDIRYCKLLDDINDYDKK